MIEVIICAGMRRAASRFQYYVLAELGRRMGDNPVGWIRHQDFDETYDVHEWEGKGRLILKSHAYLPDYSALAQKLIHQKRAIVITCHRDIRDVMGSIKVALNKNWSQASFKNEVSSTINEFEKWSKVADYIADYERTNPAIEVKVMANLAGYDIGFGEATDIASLFTIEKVSQIVDGKTNYVPIGDGTPKRHHLSDWELNFIEHHYDWWLEKWGYG